MFDLHSHILPAIDDGAKRMSESLDMMAIAAECGTKTIIATPHVIEGSWLPEWETILNKTTELNQAAANAGISITILPGAEVALNMDILDRITGPGQYCINSTQYMLVELPATHIPPFADDFFFTLQARGITPILAHPERHHEIGNNPWILLEWIRRGILTQMNGTSFTGRMGERTMKTAELLLTNNMIHLLGSDAHSPRQRTPRLTEARTKLHSLVDPDYAEQITTTNPSYITQGQDLTVPEVYTITYPTKKKTLKSLIASVFS